MPYTVHSIGRTPEEQKEIRVWLPWMRTLALENLNADRNYGDQAFETMAIHEFHAKKFASMDDLMRVSDCADCRAFAGMAMYPVHSAPLAGHRNHCTCNGCF